MIISAALPQKNPIFSMTESVLDKFSPLYSTELIILSILHKVTAVKQTEIAQINETAGK